MICPISTPKCDRTDICISLPNHYLHSLISAGQAVFLVAEVGMEWETLAVAEALAAKMTNSPIEDIDVFDEYLYRQPVTDNDNSTANIPIDRALAGLPPRNFFSSPDDCDPEPSECSKKPLLIDKINLLHPAGQRHLFDSIKDRKIQIFKNDCRKNYDIRPNIIFSAVYESMFYLSGRCLFDNLKRSVSLQLLYELLPGLIEIAPLRKAINHVDSYVDFYLKGLKEPREASEGLDGEIYIDQDALKLLKTHSWPGNYDELRIILKRCSIFAAGDPVSAKDVEAALEGFRIEEKNVEPALKYDVPQKFALDEVMKSTEAHLIKQILKNAGTLKEVSEILGFNSPQAFDKRIRTLGITLPPHLGRKGSKKSDE